jgi:hypothetical protein
MNKQRESTIPSNIYANKQAIHPRSEPPATARLRTIRFPFPFLSLSLEPHDGGRRTLDPMDATQANRKIKKEGGKIKRRPVGRRSTYILLSTRRRRSGSTVSCHGREPPSDMPARGGTLGLSEGEDGEACGGKLGDENAAGGLLAEWGAVAFHTRVFILPRSCFLCRLHT